MIDDIQAGNIMRMENQKILNVKIEKLAAAPKLEKVIGEESEDSEKDSEKGLSVPEDTQ